MANTETSDDRCRRLMDTALDLVATGGFDALQVRTLTERTGISSKTVYQLFPSKEYLLLAASAGFARDLQRRLLSHPPPGRTARQRVKRLVDQLSEMWATNPPATAAVFRALLCGKPEVADQMQAFGDTMKSMFLMAIASESPTPQEAVVADILESVLFSALVGWLTGLQDPNYVAESMDRAARLLLPGPGDLTQRKKGGASAPRSAVRPRAKGR